MRVYRALDELAAAGPKRRSVTVGVFDGVHRGHLRIIEATRMAAGRQELDASLALTFRTHPLALVAPERAPKLILDLDERIAALAATGLDELLILPFDETLAATPYPAFTRDLLVEALGMEQLVAGYDFHLGRGRAGNAEAMAALGESLGFRVEVVTPCYQGGRIISSTRIRDDLRAGRLDAVAEALGRPYTLGAMVESGEGRGAGLGFPTANLTPPGDEKLLPPPGVYLVAAEVEGERSFGLMNLGWAPTLKGRFTPEIHLLDRSVNLQGRYLQCEVLQWIRAEKRFSGVDALREAIAADVDEARRRIREIETAGS